MAANEVVHKIEPLVREAKVCLPQAVAVMLDGPGNHLVVATVSVGHGQGPK